MTEEKIDLAAYKKIGMVQQKQPEYFALRLHAVAGDFTTAQLQKVVEVAEKYGKSQVHLSTRQGIEIHWVHHSNLEAARAELKSAGIEMGACGPRVRIMVACPGAEVCKWGIIETKEIAKKLDQDYFRQDTPYKFKMAVTGCPNNCAKATENDVGVMGGIIPQWQKSDCIDCNLCVNVCPTEAIYKEGNEYKLNLERCIHCPICTKACPTNAWGIAQEGYVLSIGGTMGKKPRIGTKLTGIIEDKNVLYQLIDRALKYYQQNGRKKERFGHMLDRIGVDKVKEELLRGI